MIGIVSICLSQHKGANYISPHWTTLVYLWLQAAEAVASKMHFSYAGITCYYAILVWESLAANSDRAKPRASSRSRQPFKGQLNASLAQGGSTKALKNNFFLPWRNLPSSSASALCTSYCRSLFCNSKRIFSFVSVFFQLLFDDSLSVFGSTFSMNPTIIYFYTVAYIPSLLLLW